MSTQKDLLGTFACDRLLYIESLRDKYLKNNINFYASNDLGQKNDSLSIVSLTKQPLVRPIIGAPIYRIAGDILSSSEEIKKEADASDKQMSPSPCIYYTAKKSTFVDCFFRSKQSKISFHYEKERVSMTIRELEQLHLSFVYQQLVQAKASCEQLLQRENERGKVDLKNSGEELRLNFDNAADRLDTFAAIEIKNREVDQRKASIQMTETKLEKVQRLTRTPYFGKVDLQFPDEEQVDAFYIGTNGFADEQNQNLIYDWRSPIAELFYNNQLGDASYEVNGQLLSANIRNRRQLVTEKDRLRFVFDTAVAIDDERLLSVLEENATEAMKDITASIQQEQNLIIRDQSSPVLLVNGVAGSGKTSVVMQRIAYLLYRHRQTITSDSVLILSPNEHFIQYISEVLPALGEKNPINLTFLGLIQSLCSNRLASEQEYFQRITQSTVAEQDQILRGHGFISFIKKAGEGVLLKQEPPFAAIRLKKQTLIAKETILKFYRNTPQGMSFSEKIQATKNQLKSAWERRLTKQSQSQKIQEQLLLLSEEQQMRHFGKLIPDEPKQLAFYARKLLEKKYKKVTEAIENREWLDVTSLVQTLYESYTGQYFTVSTSLDFTVTFLLVKQLFVKKAAVATVDLLCIDEVQDYTPAQLFLLAELFPKAKITAVGDEDQAIFKTHSTFDEMSQIFEEQQRSTKIYHLQKSYRSSGAITELFQQLSNQKKIIAVQSSGAEPIFERFESKEDFKKLIEKKLSREAISELTIITKTMDEADRLTQLFGELVPVKIYPVSLAKGLEFDHVVLFDVSANNYQTLQDKRLLYTAVSRAMKTLSITYQKVLTTLFD